MEEKTMIANMWQTPDGTILWSRYTHDSVNYIDENGIRYMVDGGNDYCHLSEIKTEIEYGFHYANYLMGT